MKSEGRCRLCNKLIAGRVMERHLRTCINKTKSNRLNTGSNTALLLKAECSPFFVYFEIDTSKTLKHVDHFLRDLWLECCGHMSAFKMGNTSYSSHPNPELDGKSMSVRLKEVIKPGMNFTHEYDFGTTTYLTMKCISERKDKLTDIKILARNKMPELKCDNCEKTATKICSECFWDGQGFLCKTCAKGHKCGEDMLLPFVNSPRSGMCGFDGSCSLIDEDRNI